MEDVALLLYNLSKSRCHKKAKNEWELYKIVDTPSSCWACGSPLKNKSYIVYNKKTREYMNLGKRCYERSLSGNAWYRDCGHKYWFYYHPRDGEVCSKAMKCKIRLDRF